MNPNDILGNLGQGLAVCQTPGQIDPAVLAALANAVTSQRTVTKIADPVNTTTVDLSTLGDAAENRPVFTFTNAIGDGQPVTYWFSPYLNRPGAADAFGAPGRSANDFPAAQGDGVHIENGGTHLATLNTLAYTMPGGYIVNRIDITVPANNSIQQRTPLQIFTTNVQNDPCTSRVTAPTCTTCNENNNSTTVVTSFRGALGSGVTSSFGYAVQDGVTVQVELYIIGTGAGQYSPLGGGNC